MTRRKRLQIKPNPSPQPTDPNDPGLPDVAEPPRRREDRPEPDTPVPPGPWRPPSSPRRLLPS